MAKPSYTTAQIAEAIYGDPFVQARTRLSQEAYEASKRKARVMGYLAYPDFVRDAIHMATFGSEAILQCHASRMHSMSHTVSSSEPDTDFGDTL